MSLEGDQDGDPPTDAAVPGKIGAAFAALHDATVAITARDDDDAHDRLQLATSRAGQALAMTLALQGGAAMAHETNGGEE